MNLVHQCLTLLARVGALSMKEVETSVGGENGPICEPPTETDLTARACHYYHSEICNEFDT